MLDKAQTGLGKFMKKVDFFTSPIMLRYENQERMASKTGGLFSISLIGIIIAVTFTSWLMVFNRSKITIEMSEERQADPSSVHFTKKEFLFMLNMYGQNLSNPSRFFDIEVTQQMKLSTKDRNRTPIKMTMCRKQDLAPYGKQIYDSYDTLELSGSLCPQTDELFRITGKWSSPVFQYIRILIKRCDKSDPNCLPDSQFDEIDVFYLNYLFVNRIINPVQSDPIRFYIHDQIYHQITPLMALQTNMYLKQYNIKTDESIMPFKLSNISRGFTVEISNVQNFYVPLHDGQAYSIFYFRKSSAKQAYVRSYMKIDDLLSYLGGLFGTLAFAFGLIVRDYNLYCFEIEMCHKVFEQDYEGCDDTQKQSASQSSDQSTSSQQSHQSYHNIDFNFLTYVKYLLYRLITMVNPDFVWKQMKILRIKIEEIRNQMNIDHLLQKITYYERSFQSLLDEDQLLLLYLQEKISLRELKKQRDLINMKDTHKGQIDNLSTSSNLKLKTLAIFKSPQISPQIRRQSILDAHHRQSIFQGTNRQKSMMIARKVLQTNSTSQKSTDDQLNKIIKKSIKEVQKRASNGDIVSQRILERLRPELVQKCIHPKKNKVILPSLYHSNGSKSPILKDKRSIQFQLPISEQ